MAFQYNGQNFESLNDEPKRILITGGAGLIGSNLAGKLLEEGHEVIVMDNLYSASKRNINQFLGRKNFEFIRHDVTLPFSVEADEIYHLACPASPIYYQRDPVYTIKTSFYGALNVLETAKRTGAKVLLASTSEVYGDPLVHPQPESYWGNVNTIGPRSCYDEGKRAAETLFSDYQQQYGVDIKIARIFNTYGPNMSPNDGRVISNFIMQSLQGLPITIYGDGNQTRSFCYVSDLISGLEKLMQHENYEGPVNLGNPVEISIQEVAEEIFKIVGGEQKMLKMPLPTDDPIRRRPNISKAKEMLQWEPEVSFSGGLIKTIDYFKKTYVEGL